MADISTQIMRHLYRKASKEKIPFSGTFELTPCCNMDCKMCYVRMSKEEQRKTGKRELTAKEWISLAKEAKECGMGTLLLTGGEPFLRSDLEEICREVQQMGILLNMNSNATMIDERAIEWLKKSPPTRVNVTLYGGSNASYERLCGNPNGYEQAIRGIRLLREAGIFVNINVSLTPYNSGDMEAIFQKIHEFGLAARPTAYMFPPVRRTDGRVEDSARFSPEEAGQCQVKADQLKLGQERFEARVKALHQGICCMDEENECIRDSEKPISCMAGTAAFWMTWDGRMLPCGMMNEPCFYPLEVGFQKAWTETVKAIEEAEIHNGCGTCGKRFACPVCRALILAETGDLKEKPKYLCRMTDTYLEANEKIYKKIML